MQLNLLRCAGHPLLNLLHTPPHLISYLILFFVWPGYSGRVAPASCLAADRPVRRDYRSRRKCIRPHPCTRPASASQRRDSDSPSGLRPWRRPVASWSSIILPLRSNSGPVAKPESPIETHRYTTPWRPSWRLRRRAAKPRLTYSDPFLHSSVANSRYQQNAFAIRICSGVRCVASATSGQNVSEEMRDFDRLQVACRGSEVYEQERTSAVHGGAEARDFA